MEIKRKIKILVETKRRFIIQPPETSLDPEIVCPECAAAMIQAEQLAMLLGVGRRSVYQTIERGAWHFVETRDGFLYVCTKEFEQKSIIE